jgi:hypothetical protein
LRCLPSRALEVDIRKAATALVAFSANAARLAIIFLGLLIVRLGTAEQFGQKPLPPVAKNSVTAAHFGLTSFLLPLSLFSSVQ